MANVPVPVALRDELRLSDMVVWEAKREKKGLPVHVRINGPGLTVQPYGVGDTIEDAVAAALGNPWFRSSRPGVMGAMARLDMELWRLNTSIWMEREKVTGVRDLDDDVPF